MIQVCCAIIREMEGNILAAQRGPNMRHPNKWEFPGGKVEEGESLRDCIRREVMEELNLGIQVSMAYPPVVFAYPDLEIELFPFSCSIQSGSLQLREHRSVRWCSKRQLMTLDWAAADKLVVQQLAQTWGMKIPWT